MTEISTRSARGGGDGRRSRSHHGSGGISTRSARGGGDDMKSHAVICLGFISTRSARGGGDDIRECYKTIQHNFNPLRPWGRRRASPSRRRTGACDFNPLRPWGRRPVQPTKPGRGYPISTHSARGGGD